MPALVNEIMRAVAEYLGSSLVPTNSRARAWYGDIPPAELPELHMVAGVTEELCKHMPRERVALMLRSAFQAGGGQEGHNPHRIHTPIVWILPVHSEVHVL
jgi:hypothetical protein